MKNKELILNTANWAQGYPYNSQYPMDFNMGCLTIALGDIMFYYKHPISGTGIVYGKDDPEGIVLDNFNYDWESIPKKIDSYDSERSIFMTSTLLSHVAMACKVIPARGGVGGDIFDGISALINHFKYDRNIVAIDINDEELCYTQKEITELVISQIDNHMPVGILIPGHIIVCNGYNSEGMFSCNYGWGRGDEWTTLDKYGCNPTMITIGIQPKKEDFVFLLRSEVSFDGKNCGDEGNLALHLSAPSDYYSITIRAILYDNASVKRSIISEEINYSDLLKNNGKIKIKLPDDITFGKRFIGIECSKKNENYRPIRFRESDEIISHEINCERSINKSLLFKSSSTLPESISIGEEFEVSVNIEVIEPCTSFIAVILTDNQYNQIALIGKSGIINFNVSKKNHVIYLPCKIENVISEKKYRYLIVTSLSDSFSDSTPSILNEFLDYKKEVYVKNKDISYNESIELISYEGLDLSKPFYDLSTYHFDATIKVNKKLEKSELIYTIVTDDNNNILSKLASNDVIPVIPKTKKYELLFPDMNTVDKNEVKKINLSLCIRKKTSSGYIYEMLKPATPQISNPIKTALIHRNLFDFIYIKNGLFSSNETVVKERNFTIKSDLYLNAPESIIGLFQTDISVFAENKNGVKLLIGKLKDISIEKNYITEIIINCQFDRFSPAGEYKINILASNNPIESENPDHYINTESSTIKNSTVIMLED